MGNTVEAVGAENCTWDWEKESVNIKKRQRELQILDEDIDLYKYEGSKALKTFIKTADLMLAGPFNFSIFTLSNISYISKNSILLLKYFRLVILFCFALSKITFY